MLSILRAQRNQALDGLAACGGALEEERQKNAELQAEIEKLKSKKKVNP